MTTNASASTSRPAAILFQRRGFGPGTGLEVASGKDFRPDGYTRWVQRFQMTKPDLGMDSRRPPLPIQITYFFCSLLSASFSALASASAAFTFTSGSTPVPSQLVFEMGLTTLMPGTRIVKWSSMRCPIPI